MKIIDLIKKVLKEKGIDQKYASRIEKTFKVEKEEEIAAAIESFSENILPAITEAEKAAKETAKTEVEKIAIAEYEKKYGLKDGKPIDPKAKDNPIGPEQTEVHTDTKPVDIKFDNIDPAIKALLDNQNKQLIEMKELLTTSRKEAEEAKKVATAKSLLKGAKLPENWIDRIKLDSEVKFEDQIKTLETEYLDIQQKTINEKVAKGEYTPGGFQIPDRSEADWLKIMNGDEGEKAPGVAPLE